MTDRWVSFDCFGTLIDWRDGFAAILRRAGVRRVDEVLSAYHRAEPGVEAQPYRCYREVLAAALDRALQASGDSVPATVLSDEWHTLPAFADTQPSLRALRDEGWSLAILTNCDVDLFEQVEPALGVPIDRVVTAQDVRSYKPAPAHFHRFRETIGNAPWVHVAASWFHDIAPARTAGIPRVWIDRERSGDDPAIATRVLPDLEDLPSVLRLLLR